MTQPAGQPPKEVNEQRKPSTTLSQTERSSDDLEAAMLALLLPLLFSTGMSAGPAASAASGLATVPIQVLEDAIKGTVFAALIAMLISEFDIDASSAAAAAESGTAAAVGAADAAIKNANKPVRTDLYDERARQGRGGMDPRVRAARVAARVGATAGTSAGRDEAAARTGFSLKQWHTRIHFDLQEGRVRVRPDHLFLEGKMILMAESFQTPSGWSLRRPGDRSAPLDAWIGCRCWLSYS